MTVLASASGKLLHYTTVSHGLSSCTTPKVVTEKNMVMSPVGPRTKNDCAGECQQQITALHCSQSWTEHLHDSQSRDRKILSWTPRGPEPRMTAGEGQQQYTRLTDHMSHSREQLWCLLRKVTLLSSKRRLHFKIHKLSWNKQKCARVAAGKCQQQIVALLWSVSRESVALAFSGWLFVVCGLVRVL
jgi:hypothetical protein